VWRAARSARSPERVPAVARRHLVKLYNRVVIVPSLNALVPCSLMRSGPRIETAAAPCSESCRGSVPRAAPHRRPNAGATSAGPAESHLSFGSIVPSRHVLPASVSKQASCHNGFSPPLTAPSIPSADSAQEAGVCAFLPAKEFARIGRTAERSSSGVMYAAACRCSWVSEVPVCARGHEGSGVSVATRSTWGVVRCPRDAER